VPFSWNGPGFLRRRRGRPGSQLGLWGLEQLRATTRLPSGTLVPTLSAKNCACSGSLKP